MTEKRTASDYSLAVRLPGYPGSLGHWKWPLRSSNLLIPLGLELGEQPLNFAKSFRVPIFPRTLNSGVLYPRQKKKEEQGLRLQRSLESEENEII